jgi:transposase
VTEQQLLRMARRRLAILRHAEEITGNVALTCRYYGISRQCFYTWRRRYDAHGLDGLRDRSHRPQVSPNATRTEVVGKVIYLRHHFGPARIAMYLKHYHEVRISPSGVWRILKRLELNRLPASQRHKRHDRRWQRSEQAASWPPRPAGCEVHPAAFRRPKGQEVLPVHRDRRLHPAAGPAHLPQAQPADGHPVLRSCAGAAAVPGGGHPDRQRARVR